MRSSQRGFGVVEVILALVVVAGIGFIGWRVYDARQDDTTDQSQQTTTGQEPVQKSETANDAPLAERVTFDLMQGRVQPDIAATATIVPAKGWKFEELVSGNKFFVKTIDGQRFRVAMQLNPKNPGVATANPGNDYLKGDAFSGYLRNVADFIGPKGNTLYVVDDYSTGKSAKLGNGVYVSGCNAAPSKQGCSIDYSSDYWLYIALTRFNKVPAQAVETLDLSQTPDQEVRADFVTMMKTLSY